MDHRINRLERLGLNAKRLDQVLGHADVRPADPADAEALAAIYNETALDGRTSPGTERQSVAGMQYLIIRTAQLSHSQLYVVTAHGQVAGYVRLQPFSWEPQACPLSVEIDVYLGRAWHRAGLGIHLGGLAATLAEQIGYVNLVAWIMDANPASRRLAQAGTGVAWGHFPKLARSGESLVDISVFGTSLATFFASAWGRRMRQRQATAWREYQTYDAGLASRETSEHAHE